MPITQDRMIRLISAGDQMLKSHQRLLAEAKDQYRELCLEAPQGNPLIDKVLQKFDNLVYAIERAGPTVETTFAIAKEQGHFKAWRKHNDRGKEQMARLRRRRAREANPDLDDDYYENLEEAEPAEPVEISIPERPLNYDQLHQQLWDIWVEHQKDESSMNVNRIIEVLREAWRITSEAKQAEAIKTLMARGTIIQQQIRSEYIVTEPGQPSGDVPADPEIGGLLPNRIIGLKKRVEGSTE